MVDIVFRIDPSHPPAARDIKSAAEARRLLEQGNEQFANLHHATADHQDVVPIDARALGISKVEGLF